MHWTRELLKLHDAWMLRALIKHLVCEEGGGERQTNQQPNPQMKYKTGETEFKANFILGQISSSAQGWRNICSSIFRGCWDLASCNTTQGCFKLLPWYKGICGDLKAYGIIRIQNIPQFQRDSVFLWHATASLYLRAGLVCICLLRIGAGVAAQCLGTAIRTTWCGKAWHRIAWYQHGWWPGTAAGSAPSPQRLPEGANGEHLMVNLQETWC